MVHVHVITPCSRPENLPKLYTTIQKLKSYTWHVCFDSKRTSQFFTPRAMSYVARGGLFGTAQRNHILEHLYQLDNDDYVYFLDDDNLLHPDVIAYFNGNPTLDLAFAKYQYRGRTLRLETELHEWENVRLAGVDTAQVLVKLKALKGYYWDEERYDADGLMAVHLKETVKDAAILPIRCYYNALNYLRVYNAVLKVRTPPPNRDVESSLT